MSDDTSRTHRCIDCPLGIEHTPQELCPSCGRCGQHCQGGTDRGHEVMHRVGDQLEEDVRKPSS